MGSHTGSQALVPTYIPATSNLTECTRDLIQLAARLNAVHEAVITAVLVLNAYEVELDRESSKHLRQRAHEAICDHFKDLHLNLHCIEQCLNPDAA